MERKQAEVKARMAPTLKKEAEKYLSHYQLNLSQAINMFFARVVEVKGLPFDLRPTKETLEAMQELEQGKVKRYASLDDMMNDILNEED